jgi:hypothetical protein
MTFKLKKEISDFVKEIEKTIMNDINPSTTKNNNADKNTKLKKALVKNMILRREIRKSKLESQENKEDNDSHEVKTNYIKFKSED